MVKKAEFGEKEYEGAISLEIAAQTGDLRPSYETLEAVVGYDAAFAVGSPRLWRRLGLGGPIGAMLRSHFPNESNRLPARRMSLVLQYKRPEYVEKKPTSGTVAKQWDMWKKPFYRFKIEKKQQKILLGLQGKVSTTCVVRYACPAFWEYDEYEKRCSDGSLIDGSTFVSPKLLGTTHSWLTYDRPTRQGKPNQPTEEFQTDDWKALSKALYDSSVEYQSFGAYVGKLAGDLGLSDEEVEELYSGLRQMHYPEDFEYFVRRYYGMSGIRQYSKFLAIRRWMIRYGYFWASFSFQSRNSIG